LVRIVKTASVGLPLIGLIIATKHDDFGPV